MSNQEFAGFDPVALSYVPPAACPGPWAKVVLEADYSVTAGVQFDRTGLINLGGVNIYFGTTMEPGSQTARAWHVERDLTDYTATLLTAQSGQAILGNVVDSTYTGRIFGSATLKFYPAGRGAPVTPAAQLVLPLAPSVTSLSPTNPTLSATLTLPRNIERLYLDVIAQSQGDDEFWYTCVPDQYASVLQSCPGGAFREVEVSIDGTPAGVAPVYPWIYTGGISPSLWAPTPGVQTLNFDPYRVDLTPFAGTLNDGQPHTVAVQVYGAQDSFSVTGTLLAWRDAGAPVVTGAVTGNTLTAPTVNVNAAGLRINGSSAKGPLIVSSARSYVISGSVNTSHGGGDDPGDAEHRLHEHAALQHRPCAIRPEHQPADAREHRDRDDGRQRHRDEHGPVAISADAGSERRPVSGRALGDHCDHADAETQRAERRCRGQADEQRLPRHRLAADGQRRERQQLVEFAALQHDIDHGRVL